MAVVESDYQRDLRAWRLRLAEWLGLDAAVLVDIDASAGRHSDIEVQWRTIDCRVEAGTGVGRYVSSTQFESDGERVTYTDGLRLHGLEAQRMVAEVGPRPEALTPEQALMLDGLRWRAQNEQQEPSW